MAARWTPGEDQEQRSLAAWLDLRRVLWCHVPNGGLRHPATAHRLRLAGVKAGVPDVLVFTPPPRVPGRVGCALELKRQGRRSATSDAQRAWLAELAQVGWQTAVCGGAVEAIEWLQDMGY